MFPPKQEGSFPLRGFSSFFIYNCRSRQARATGFPVTLACLSHSSLQRRKEQLELPVRYLRKIGYRRCEGVQGTGRINEAMTRRIHKVVNI